MLDGIHRLRNDTLGVLYQLMYDRELQLFDGTRLVSPQRFDALRASMSEAELEAAGIRSVHPSFRVLALATPPTTQNPWLIAEILGLFSFHGVPTALPQVRADLLRQLFPDVPEAGFTKLLTFAERLEAMASDSVSTSSQSLSLSMRQLVRVCRRISAYVRPLPFLHAHAFACNLGWPRVQISGRPGASAACGVFDSVLARPGA